MDRWSNLNMQQKAKLLGIYASKGYTDLASIINHYNTFQEGGPISTITINLPPVKIKAHSPYKLNDYQKAILKKYYSNPDGSYTEKGKEYAKQMHHYNTTGRSQFMEDINRLSPTNALHESISNSRKFIQDTPGLEFLYDAVSTGLTFSPLAPIGIAMQGLDAIGGLNDMLDNGVTYENAVDVLGITPVKIKGNKMLGKVLNPHTGKVTYSTTEVPKQLLYDIPVGVNELLVNDLMINSIPHNKDLNN